MPRVRHENSIDNVPLHMSARGEIPSDEKGEEDEGRRTGDDERRRGKVRERDRERCSPEMQ